MNPSWRCNKRRPRTGRQRLRDRHGLGPLLRLEERRRLGPLMELEERQGLRPPVKLDGRRRLGVGSGCGCGYPGGCARGCADECRCGCSGGRRGNGSLHTVVTSRRRARHPMFACTDVSSAPFCIWGGLELSSLRELEKRSERSPLLVKGRHGQGSFRELDGKCEHGPSYGDATSGRRVAAENGCL